MSASHRPSSSTARFGSSFTNQISRAANGSAAAERNAKLGGPLLSPTKNTGTSQSRGLGLDRFRYASPTQPSATRSYSKPFSSVTAGTHRPGNVSRSTSNATIQRSDAETISSGSDSERGDRERPPKKKKFRRARAPSSPEISPVKATVSRAEESKDRPIVVSDSGDDGGALDVAGSSFARQAERIANVLQGRFSQAECVRALRECKGSPKEALFMLQKRSGERSAAPDANRRVVSAMPSSLRDGPSSSTSTTTAKFIRQSNPLAVRPAGSIVRSAQAAGASARSSASSSKPSKRADRSSDSDSGSGGRGGWGSASDSDRESSRRARAAVTWFNDASEATLVETIGCSAAQAKIIGELRPFDSADEAEEKLRATKGVTAKLFTDYIDLLASFAVVDQVLKRCEKRAARLEEACSPKAIAADEHHLKDKPRGMASEVELKDYQLDGVNWLSLRYRNDTSCILADDMGTGKTCQVIAFLCDLKDRGVKGVNLVVAPSSTVENWSRELKRFGPNLNFRVFAGSQAERREIRYEIEEDHRDLDVILTSYNSATAATDIRFFKKFGFNACVYDEGHQLKNQNTQNYRSLMQVGAQWRLLLTGTPLQNNLLELMSLLNFIMPRDFKNASSALEDIFKAKGNARDSQLSKSRVDRAKRMMGPFVLRRLKDKVLTLPPKKIHIEYCDMTPHQAKIYRKVLARTRLELLEHDDEGKATRKKKDQSSNILMRLRKGAIHPMMFRTIYTADKIKALARDYVKEPQFMDANLTHLEEDFAINSDAELSQLAAQYPHTRKHQVDGSAWLNSGKITALRRLIADIRSRGEKLVIFSQFEMALFLLMSALDEMQVRWIAFSGRTKVDERQGVIDEFQGNPDIPVFLLTTKAGGVGVNLTAANWVIMLDQDFNPQNDKQAEDRCWRIGQEKEVTVVKLISKGTIDEDILALGQQKLELAARVSGMETGAGGGAANGHAADGESNGVSGGKADAEGNDVPPAVSEAVLEDDSAAQENTTRSLLSKLRDRAQEGAGGSGGTGGRGAKGAGGDDDDDDSDVEILE
ncbi:unnamed protein product [Parajaminaea phylloscopi]